MVGVMNFQAAHGAAEAARSPVTHSQLLHVLACLGPSANQWDSPRVQALMKDETRTLIVVERHLFQSRLWSCGSGVCFSIFSALVLACDDAQQSTSKVRRTEFAKSKTARQRNSYQRRLLTDTAAADCGASAPQQDAGCDLRLIRTAACVHDLNPGR